MTYTAYQPPLADQLCRMPCGVPCKGKRHYTKRSEVRTTRVCLVVHLGIGVGRLQLITGGQHGQPANHAIHIKAVRPA